MRNVSSRPASVTELLRENETLRARLAEAQDVIRAIQSGDVKTVAVSGPDGDPVFTLKHAEHVYRALLEAMNEGAATIAVDGTVLYCNRKITSLLRIPMEKVIGNSATSLIASADQNTFSALLANAFAGKDGKAEIQLQVQDGTVVPVYISLGTLHLNDVPAACMVITDLCEDKKREKLIEEAQRLVAAIVESSDDAIYTKSFDGVITTWNRGAERLFGYTAAEAIGQKVTLVVPLEGLPELYNMLERVTRGERVEHHECVRICKDGRRVHVSITLSPLKNKRGKITGASAIARDITESELTRRALAESEARFRSLVEASPDAIFVHCGGKIVFANPATLKLFGGDAPEQIVGKAASDFVHLDYQAIIGQRIATNYRLGKLSAPLESVHLRLDGSPVDVEAIGIPILWQGSPAMEVVARDITERKRAQQTVVKWQKRLELAEQAALPIGLWEWDIGAIPGSRRGLEEGIPRLLAGGSGRHAEALRRP